MKQAKKWLFSFALISLSVVLVLSVLVYIVDPAFQFRVRDDRYMLNSQYVAPGLVKNQEYDAILIGSSMIQNWDMDRFEETLGGEVLKAGVGGMNTVETLEYLSLAYEADKADTYYICIDISFFRTEEPSKNYAYLLGDDVISRLKYFISYETWLRYLPLDVASSALVSMDKLPASLKQMSHIDKLGDWSQDFPCSREAVLKNYFNKSYGVSAVDLDGLEEKMKANIDGFFQQIDGEKGEHVFFMPPYSSLFWCDAQRNGYFDAYVQAKEHFYEAAAKAGCQVYDFQADPLTGDLDNYKDLTHYGAHINDWMAEQMAAGQYLVTAENAKSFGPALAAQTERFRSENPELFEEEK